MTDWTPEIRVWSLPPNTNKSNPKTEIVDWIDYNISISRGSSEYISAPYPAQAEITLLFPDNVVPDIELGTWIGITVDSAIYSDGAALQTGYVTEMTSSYRAWGNTGFVLEWKLNLTSAISIFQNMSWYNETNFTDTTANCINKVEDDIGRFIWEQINANLTWADYGPLAWDEVDTAVLSNLPNILGGTSTITAQLTSGFRNVWDDLVTLCYGVNGWIYEDASGVIYLDTGQAIDPLNFTITPEMISPDIVGGQSVGKLRNEITITEFDGVSSTYYDDESIRLYGERSGVLNTYLVNTADAATVGQIILNGLAYPLLATEQFGVDLLNPILTDAQRIDLLYNVLGKKVSLQAPIPMGGTQLYQTIGCQYQITKDSFFVSVNLAPYSQQYNSKNWDQIGYNYTWTSYGVAFPTQEWSDL